MRKKKLFALAAAFLVSGSSFAESLEWDFSKGASPQGGKMVFSVVAPAEIRDGALCQKNVGRTSPGGIVSREKYPELTPGEAFRITFVLTLEEPRVQDPFLMLWDNKADYYEKGTGDPKDNSGFTIALNRSKDGKIFIPRAWLGFGAKTATLKGKPVQAQVGRKYTVEFYYNGGGMAAFYVDGMLNEEVPVEPGGPLSPAGFRTMIGNRCVGNYSAFDGKLHSVKLEFLKAETLICRTVGRKVFQRGEPDAALSVEVRNVSGKNAEGLKSGESRIFRVPVETNLTPGEHAKKFSFGGTSYELKYRIAPATHDRMSIIMWDFSDNFRHLKKSGFTHLVLATSAVRFLRPKQYPKDAVLESLDEMLMEGFFRSDYFAVPHYPSVVKNFPRIDREGKPVRKGKRGNADVNDPKAYGFFKELAEKSAAFYENHPAMRMLDICSEIRDWTAPSFSKYEKEACIKATGADIPDVVSEKTIHYQQIPGFPPGRIIPDDHPVLAYYRWFWTDGDGWNPMFSAISDAYRSKLTHDFKTYFAPATRQPPIRGAGGNADMLGQWTYSNPEPLFLAASADELLAVANGKPVIQGTQLICYRNQTAPIQVKVSPEPEWVAKEPKAGYITNPPDLLVESIWATLSRPVSGMVFHGDGSFYPAPVKGSAIYRMTNPEAEPAFRNLMETVVKPLGPALKRIPGGIGDVAILHSFTSAVLALRGSYGWGGWLMNLHVALQLGGLDPSVIYEQDVMEGKLKDVKVLVLSHCDVLTESIYREITEFQLNGGIIVADETVPPAILPNIRIHSFGKSGDALENKAKLVRFGTDLKKKLLPHCSPKTSSDQSDLVAHARGNYLFVINDRRTFGNYIGQWKRAAEKALPNSGTVSIKRGAGAVYDLVQRKAVPFKSNGKTTEIPVQFDGAGGKVLLLLDKPLSSPVLNVSPDGEVLAKTGTDVTIPVQLVVKDSSGKETDDTHYSYALNGEFRYRIIVPADAVPGTWTVEFRSLPTNASVTGTLKVGRAK